MNKVMYIVSQVVTLAALALTIGGVGSAHAAYICGLTATEMDDLMDYYGSADSSQTLGTPMTAPFSCTHHGPLCEQLGAAGAELFLCGIWDDARDELSLATIAANAEIDFLARQESWISAQFPSGIPANATFWALGDTETSSDNLKRLKHSSWALPLPLLSWIGSTVTLHSRNSTAVNFPTSVTLSSITLTSTFSSSDANGSGPDCTTSPQNKSGNGRVTKGEVGSRLGVWAAVFNQLDASASTSGVPSTSVSADGLWFDLGCP